VSTAGDAGDQKPIVLLVLLLVLVVLRLVELVLLEVDVLVVVACSHSAPSRHMTSPVLSSHAPHAFS
jgi:hypothetical protein